MSVSDWRSHLNSLKASKLNGVNKRGAAEETLPTPNAAPAAAPTKAGAAKDTQTTDKENVNYRNAQMDRSHSRNYADETAQSWPEYSGLEETTCVEEQSYDDSRRSCATEEVSDSASGLEAEQYELGGVAKALTFGGGDSVEVERSTGGSNRGQGQAFQHFQHFPQAARAPGQPPADAAFLQEEEGAGDGSGPVHDRPTDRTPPRPPLSQRAPALTDSPSTTKLNSQSAKAMGTTVQTLLLPSDKESRRMAVSPTSSRTDSEFGRQLAASQERDRGATAAAATTRARPRTEKERPPAAVQAAHQPADEWKAAVTDGGKRYYYNRRTRLSAWRLPAGALCAEPAPGTSTNQEKDSKAAVVQATDVDQTPPGQCAQRRQREGQRHAKQLQEDTLAKHSSLAGAGAPLFCIFCGERDAAMQGGQGAFLEHLSQCARGRNGDTNEALLAVNAYLTQLAGGAMKQLPQPQRQALQNLSGTSEAGGADLAEFDWNEQSYQDYSASSSVLNQVECSTCGRTFADESKLSKHAPACLESSIKRVPYNGSRKRIVGTPMELMPARFISPGSPAAAPGTPGTGSRSTPTSSSKKNTGGGSAGKQLAGSPVKVAAPDSHVCPKCDMSVRSKDQLLKHLRSCLLEEENTENAVSTAQPSGVEAKEQLCPFCGKLNHDSTQLNRHLAICNKKRQTTDKPGSPRFGQART